MDQQAVALPAFLGGAFDAVPWAGSPAGIRSSGRFGH
jgi:hypothetical protein